MIHKYLIATLIILIASLSSTIYGQDKELRADLKSFLCKISEQDNAELSSLGIDVSAAQLTSWQNRQCQTLNSEAKDNKYKLALSADLKSGNYQLTEYKLNAARAENFSEQSRWEIGLDYHSTELKDQSLTINEEKLSVFSNLTYQPEQYKKAISFVDVSINQDDSSGLVLESNAIVGAGYAFLGEDYHASCDIAKYSLGAGIQQRQMLEQDKLDESILSHKLSVGISITESVCLKAKHTYRRIIGFSDLDKMNNSLKVEVPINANFSVFAKYLYTEDRGAAEGFKSKDEQLEFGANVTF